MIKEEHSKKKIRDKNRSSWRMLLCFYIKVYSFETSFSYNNTNLVKINQIFRPLTISFDHLTKNFGKEERNFKR